jgi:CRP-like cAMP-binding protein
MPPLDQMNGSSDIYIEDNWTQYFVSLYYSVLLLAGNDMLPQGNFQIIFSTIMIFAAAIINANIFGNIAVLLQQMYRKSSNFQEKLENATTTMKILKISEPLQKTIQHYLTSTQSTLDQQNEFDKFLNLLSPSLKSQVTKHIFQAALLSNVVFEGKTDIVDQILQNLNTLLFFPENEICTQGTMGRDIYFLAKGEVDVFVNDENLQSKFIKTLEVGSYFGEVALLKECSRTATVKSKNYSTCAALDSMNFGKLLSRYSFLRKSMEIYISNNYQDKWREFIKRSLRNVEFLIQSIPEEIIEEISYKLELKSISKGEYLFKVGQT